jgi:glutathione S-transferase
LTSSRRGEDDAPAPTVVAAVARQEHTMSLTFYGAPMSTASLTEIVLAELDIPCEKVMLDIQKGDTKKPEFLKINPNGKVPVIVHDGTTVFESSAITMYLGETFGVDKKLYPAPGPRRGEAMKWIAWSNVSLGDAVMRWTRNTMEWIPAEQRNAKAGEVAKDDIQKLLGVLDGSLAGKQYLCGADYTLADTHVSSYLDWLRHLKVDMTSFKDLEAWRERCTKRPAYAKIMAAGAGK